HVDDSFFFFQAEDGIRDFHVTGVQTCALPISPWAQVLEPGDIIKVTSDRNGYDEKWFRIDGMAYKANLDVMLQLTEVDPSDYDRSEERRVGKEGRSGGSRPYEAERAASREAGV